MISTWWKSRSLPVLNQHWASSGAQLTSSFWQEPFLCRQIGFPPLNCMNHALMPFTFCICRCLRTETSSMLSCIHNRGLVNPVTLLLKIRASIISTVMINFRGRVFEHLREIPPVYEPVKTFEQRKFPPRDQAAQIPMKPSVRVDNMIKWCFTASKQKQQIWGRAIYHRRDRLPIQIVSSDQISHDHWSLEWLWSAVRAFLSTIQRSHFHPTCLCKEACSLFPYFKIREETKSVNYMQKDTEEDETWTYDSSSNNTPNSPFRAPSCLVTFEIMIETVFWVIYLFFFYRKLEQNKSI